MIIVMKRSIGRPMKYKSLIQSLNDHQLYTPSTIAGFAEETEFIDETEPSARRLARQRIRIALGRLSKNHHFPSEGDGMVKVKGQSPTPGWFGSRWKAVLH